MSSTTSAVSRRSHHGLTARCGNLVDDGNPALRGNLVDDGNPARRGNLVDDGNPAGGGAVEPGKASLREGR